MINTFYYEDNLCGLKRSDFQRTIDGKDVDLFILKNDNGAEMAITNYGGALLAIMVPDKNGKLANVIQGHDTLEHVINSPEPFLSTLIGRYGNRIAKGKFQLGGEEYQLTINNGPNSLCRTNQQAKCHTPLFIQRRRRRIPRKPEYTSRLHFYQPKRIYLDLYGNNRPHNISQSYPSCILQPFRHCQSDSQCRKQHSYHQCRLLYSDG